MAQLPVEIDERPLPLANDSLDKRLNQIVVTRRFGAESGQRGFQFVQWSVLDVRRAQANRGLQDDTRRSRRGQRLA